VRRGRLTEELRAAAPLVPIHFGKRLVQSQVTADGVELQFADGPQS
jgi:hypothetical protein